MFLRSPTLWASTSSSPSPTGDPGWTSGPRFHGSFRFEFSLIIFDQISCQFQVCHRGGHLHLPGPPPLPGWLSAEGGGSVNFFGKEKSLWSGGMKSSVEVFFVIVHHCPLLRILKCNKNTNSTEVAKTCRVSLIRYQIRVEMYYYKSPIYL